jgi:glycosyltransferase involved in cell wall biosynthesis
MPEITGFRARDQLRIFLSSAGSGRLDGAYIPGRAHYSYRVVSTKFRAALLGLGCECIDLPRPEIYFAPVSRKLIRNPCFHLIFKPPNLFRVLKGVPNIACVAWEFDGFPEIRDRKRVIPSDDMAHMLRIPDEIWVPCEFTAQIFRQFGIKNVYTVPAPIAMPEPQPAIRFPRLPLQLDRISWINLRLGFGRYSDLNSWKPSVPSSLSDIILDQYDGEEPTVFLSILNPHDLRKNLSALVSGFLEYSARDKNALLLLKLIADNQEDRLDTILHGILKIRIAGFELIDTNKIWLTTEYLPEDVLNDLYRFASAYLCTSLAEGQNLPLMEAMSHGVVPITTQHTAMLDFIDDQNALVIATTREAIDRDDTAVGATPNLTWHRCGAGDVADALEKFAALSPAQRTQLGRNAREAIQQGFSSDAVRILLTERFDELRSNFFT